MSSFYSDAPCTYVTLAIAALNNTGNPCLTIIYHERIKLFSCLSDRWKDELSQAISRLCPRVGEQEDDWEL